MKRIGILAVFTWIAVLSYAQPIVEIPISSMTMRFMKSRCYLFFVLTALLFVGCKDEVDIEHLYVFKSQTITEFLNSREELSLFSKIVSISHNSSKEQSSSMASVLGTVGQYVVFAPRNDAMKAYLDSYYGTDNYDVDTIPRELADRIVLNCVVDLGKENESAWSMLDLYRFDGATVPNTFNDRHLVIRTDNTYHVVVNGKSRIVKGDYEMFNGRVHVVDRVVDPAPNSLSDLIAQTGNLTIFNQLLQLTTWEDSLLLFRDRTWIPRLTSLATLNNTMPKYRLHGYMAFVETDEVFHKDWDVPMPQKDSVDGHMENWAEILAVIQNKCHEMYPDAHSTDVTSCNNAINQFVSYHLVNYRESFGKLVYTDNLYGRSSACKALNILPVDGTNFIQSMGYPSRLIKITDRALDGKKYLNRHCTYDNSFMGTYQELSCDVEGIEVHGDNGEWDNYCVNGYYYPIDHVLVYDDDVKYKVLNERIRYNVVQTIPEIHNNMYYQNKEAMNVCTQGDYFDQHNFVVGKDNLIFSKKTENRVLDNMSIIIYSDIVALRLMPVPVSGNWEIRTDWAPFTENGWPICAEVYLCTDPYNPSEMKLLDIVTTGLELEHRIKFISDYDNKYDSAACFEMDKQVRNWGMRRAPKILGHVTTEREPGENGKYIYKSYWKGLRDEKVFFNVYYRGYLEAGKNYYLRFRVLNGEMTEFYNITGITKKGQTYGICGSTVELCPEHIYNNPERAEDVW